MGILTILRHGNTFDKGDTIRRVGRHTDLPLSTSGQQQALTVAKNFAEQGTQFKAIYCSPLQRTRQTAQAIANALPHAPTVTTLQFLNEVDYGPDENQPEEAVVSRLGHEALTLWDTQGILPSDWNLDLNLIRQGWQHLITEASNTEGNILAVTSNGIARFVLPLLTFPTDEAPKNLKLSTCAYAKILCEKNQKPHLQAWNIKPS